MGPLWIPIIGFPFLAGTICLLLYLKLRSEQKQTDARLARLRQKREEIAKHGEQPSDEIFQQPSLTDLQGQWRMVSVGKKGKFAPEEVFAKSLTLFTISENNYEISPMGLKGQLVVDSSKCPTHLDQHNTKGEIRLCIVRIRNGELEICQAVVGDDRPTDFNPNRLDNASLTRFARAD